MPCWLEKWTALILDFIEEEQSLLPNQLLSLRLPAPSFAPLYTPAGAVAEARGTSHFPSPASPTALATTFESLSSTRMYLFKVCILEPSCAPLYIPARAVAEAKDTSHHALLCISRSLAYYLQEAAEHTSCASTFLDLDEVQGYSSRTSCDLWKHASLTERDSHAGVSDNRVQNVVITLDKVKLTLSRPDQCQRPPLRLLNTEEVTEYLWTGQQQPHCAEPILRVSPAMPAVRKQCLPC